MGHGAGWEARCQRPGWAHQAVGGSAEQLGVAQGRGWREWGLALAGKLISFRCCSLHKPACMLSGRRRQQPRASGQAWERGPDTVRTQANPEASPDLDEEPRWLPRTTCPMLSEVPPCGGTCPKLGSTRVIQLLSQFSVLTPRSPPPLGSQAWGSCRSVSVCPWAGDIWRASWSCFPGNCEGERSGEGLGKPWKGGGGGGRLEPQDPAPSPH